jgi:hypothetical protein
VRTMMRPKRTSDILSIGSSTSRSLFLTSLIRKHAVHRRGCPRHQCHEYHAFAIDINWHFCQLRLLELGKQYHRGDQIIHLQFLRRYRVRIGALLSRASERNRAYNISLQRLIMVVLAVILIAPAVAAQTDGNSQAQPKRLRFDFTPSAGYRTSMSFAIPSQVDRSNSQVIFESSPSYGIAFGMRLDEEDLVEFRWARQDTYMHLEDVSQSSAKQRVTLDQFHGDFTHEYTLDEWPSWARPFVMGSVGATHIVGPGNGFTRFSFGLGTGIKIFANRHLGFKFQAEWLPIWVTPEVNGFVCGGGCVVRFGGSLSFQGEFSAGPILRF